MGLSHSLRARLLGFLLGAILLAAIVQTATAYLTALSQADALFDRHMQKMASALRSGVPLTTLHGNADISSDRADEDFFVQMWTTNGTPLFESAAHRTLRQPAASGFSIAKAQDRTYRIYAIKTPSHIIQVAQDMAARRDMATALALHTAGPIVLMAPLLMLIVWWVVSRSLAPVSKVRSQMSARKADDLSPVSEAGLPDEVRPLIQELNLLFDRMRRAFEAQKNFVADAAHELRSPLAALKIQVQGLQRASDEAARQLAIQRLGSGIDRSTHLVDQLLALARQEAMAASGIEFESLDLAQVSLVALSDSLAEAQSCQIDLGVHQSEAAWIRGHAETLRLLIRNLLDNAVKYTPAGGTVDLSVETTSEGAVVTVEDTGPGIPEHDRARVLDRFYRLKTAGPQGSGLGLAIVKAIAQLHGAEVRLDHSVRLGGLRVQVRFDRQA